MDTEVLVDAQIDDGHRLLVELVRRGIDVTAAGWLRTDEEGLWFLYVGSAAIDARGVGDVYRTVYACLRGIPSSWVEMSDVRLVPPSDPVARELAAVRDRYPGGRLATRYGGKRLGTVAVREAYIYPRVTPGLTRGEVVQTVTGLMSRTGVVRPSAVTLRDGTVIRGIPYGLEMSRPAGPPAGLQVKILDDADGSTRVASVDDVSNIQ